MNRRYELKDFDNSTHEIIAQWIKETRAKQVLDLGSAGGFLADALGKDWRGSLIGIESNKYWQGSSVIRKYERVYWLNLNIIKLDRLFTKAKFDAVVCADILEHLIKPRVILKQVSRILKKNGYIIISLPNIGFLPIRIITSIFPNFRMSRGILDSTHLHYFDFEGAKKIITKSRLKINSIKVTFAPLPIIHPIFSNKPFLIFYKMGVLFARKFPQLFAYQFLFLCQPKG